MLRLQLECLLKRMCGGEGIGGLSCLLPKQHPALKNSLSSPGHWEEGRPDAEEQVSLSELARL